jgi:ABC-2 type transport system ATP-binding protein
LAAPAARAANAVEIQHVTKRFGDVQALDSVSLQVPRGEFFGLLGPNGAGKTTLISALGGLVRPDSGTLAVMGHDVTRDFREARRAVGIVPQEIVFDPFFTVRETLELQSGYFGLRRNGEWIDELLERLALQGKANANMRSLSGGMKRRVMVAQALVHRPAVIVLDEPTAGVDVELRQTLWAFVRGLNVAGHTILLTTHYLEEAQQLCSRIAMMRDGRIVALGSTETLLAEFSQRVLRVKLDNCELPARLAAIAVAEPAGWWRIPIADVAHVEDALATLREAGATVASLEVAEPELEEVFVKIMRREDRAA